MFNKSWRQQDVSPTALLNDLGWQQLNERRKQQRLMMLYKISNQLVAIPPNVLKTPGRTLRDHSKKHQTIITTCNTVKYCFFQNTIPEWNKLPGDVVAAELTAIFKRRLAVHLC